MKTCPYCHCEIRVNELPHQGWTSSHRLCPECGGAFTVDRKTKQRQSVCLVVASFSLVFTLLLYFGDLYWLIPSVFTYLVLAWQIYQGNRKLIFVPYRPDPSRNKE
ncbi:hypothetical protein [uncultured Neptuniibacter sp.]|uniref:hypothetical protein n=1 Tax=uncultured Neptuniibacter sp. TaxID=502143 RepID=UPI00261352EC|nr:hypothetical protein [uncultured Neptuniibacter sp.]